MGVSKRRLVGQGSSLATGGSRLGDGQDVVQKSNRIVHQPHRRSSSWRPNPLCWSCWIPFDQVSAIKAKIFGVARECFSGVCTAPAFADDFNFESPVLQIARRVQPLFPACDRSPVSASVAHNKHTYMSGAASVVAAVCLSIRISSGLQFPKVPPFRHCLQLAPAADLPTYLRFSTSCRVLRSPSPQPQSSTSFSLHLGDTSSTFIGPLSVALVIVAVQAGG